MNGFVSSRFTASFVYQFLFPAIHFCGRRTAWHLTNEQRRRWRSCDRSDRASVPNATVALTQKETSAQRKRQRTVQAFTGSRS